MADERPVVTQSDLVAGFRGLGLDRGLTVMAHSSLSAFGWVEGGPEAVIEALLEVLGPEGTLCLPTLCQRDRELRFETWDLAKSPSDVGRLTEVFRHWPGAIRSDHATHSVAALGPLAETITAGHATAHGRPGPWGPAAFGHGSPWDQFYRLNVRYCFLGVNFRVNTMRHYIQSVLVAEILAQAPAVRRPALEDRLTGWCQAGVWPNWDDEQMEARLAAQGLVRYGQVGAATCRAIPAKTLVDTTLLTLKAEPEAWLDDAFRKWWDEARG